MPIEAELIKSKLHSAEHIWGDDIELMKMCFAIDNEKNNWMKPQTLHTINSIYPHSTKLEHIGKMEPKILDPQHIRRHTTSSTPGLRLKHTEEEI